MKTLGERNAKRGKLANNIDEEVVVVAHPNTVIQPWTVVVKSLYAVIAH